MLQCLWHDVSLTVHSMVPAPLSVLSFSSMCPDAIHNCRCDNTVKEMQRVTEQIRLGCPFLSMSGERGPSSLDSVQYLGSLLIDECDHLSQTFPTISISFNLFDFKKVRIFVFAGRNFKTLRFCASFEVSPLFHEQSRIHHCPRQSTRWRVGQHATFSRDRCIVH